jgi:hypothetical protein
VVGYPRYEGEGGVLCAAIAANQEGSFIFLPALADQRSGGVWAARCRRQRWKDWPGNVPGGSRECATGFQPVLEHGQDPDESGQVPMAPSGGFTPPTERAPRGLPRWEAAERRC